MSDTSRASAPRIRTLVVDDERPARVGLRKMLSQDAELDVLECSNGAEAIRIIQSGAIDLVFLDIKMRDVDGFGVIEAVGADRMPVVVFTTAYSIHAIRAFEVCALDYLLKPIGDERFLQALARAKATVRQRRLGAMSDQIVALIEQHRVSSVVVPPADKAYRFAIKIGANTTYVAASEIDWVESADNYVRVWSGGRARLVREPLQRLEGVLRAEGFVRVHRSALVNIARIREIRAMSLGRTRVVLLDGTQIPLSRNRRSYVRQALRPRP